MTFSVVFEIDPPGVFGLPEAHTTAIPPTSKPVPFGFVLDTQEGKLIDRTRETSAYRTDQEKINVSLRLGDVNASILDNTMTLELEADDYLKAYSEARGIVDVFLKHLELSQGLLLKARITKIEECGRICPVPSPIPMGSLRIYNLDKLRDGIREARCSWGISDGRLARALEYFEHALLLFEIALKLAPASGRHSALCVSESFLNLWKCATSVVGDPVVRKDSYQRRCARLRLDDIQKKDLARIRLLRNDYDVAHYSLQADRMRVVQDEFGKAVLVVAELIRRYKEHLREVSQGSVGPADPSSSL